MSIFRASQFYRFAFFSLFSILPCSFAAAVDTQEDKIQEQKRLDSQRADDEVERRKLDSQRADSKVWEDQRLRRAQDDAAYRRRLDDDARRRQQDRR